ncbi:MAG: TonB-dependent receptor [Candidatus Cryptobacteroides sp.]
MKTNLLLMGIAILSAAPFLRAGDSVPSCGEPVAEITDTLSLRDVIVSSTFSNVSRSPLRLTTIDSETLRSRGAARTYPELLKGIPSLYATSESGSYGDAKLNIRGFGQENISVLLNGIPISGLVTGSMYWNNWMGLSDATYAVQVQKGVGASMLSDGSVGGSVNILTESPSEDFYAQAGFYGSGYGTLKGYVKVASGALPKGWSMNLMLSHVRGSGYVDATSVNSYAYMFSLGKRLGSEHSLIFTALGSPEKHEQRSSRLSSAEVDEYGLRYNKNWGLRDGKTFNLSLNNYFKPYFTLQHLWNGEKISMKNSVYLAVGNGGGRWSETKGRPISSYTTGGQIDWAAAIASNRNEDGSAANILSQYMAGHTHAGVLTSLEYVLGGGCRLGAGLHGQIYNTWEEERITDLLGADCWIEDYEGKSLAGLAGRNPVKVVGDKVRTENGKNICHGTAYLSFSYDSDLVSADLGASVFGSRLHRWDRYNYVGDDVLSDPASGTGASLKGGVLLKAGKGHSIYANAGWYSRLPYSNVWFSSGNNEVTRDVRNERNILGELGWRKVWSSGSLEVTAYSAYWKNKTLMSSKYRQIDSEDSRYMVRGLDALHSGVEASFFQRVGKWLEINAFASIGDWKWKNDVNAVIYDDYSGVEIGKVDVYCDGLPVADAPQTQIGASLKANLPKGFSLGADWQFNDRMYADFDPLSRTDPQDRTPSYRIPSYHLLGADASWTGMFTKFSMTLFVQVDNLLDTRFIERGKDGSSHDLDSFRGYWGFGRNASFGARISF